MKSLRSVVAQSHGGMRGPRRAVVRLLGVVPAAVLLSGLFAVSAGPLAAPVAAGVAPTGPLVFWGDNEFGQADVPVGLTGVTAIAAGAFHSLALKSNGTVAAWGDDANGQTDVPTGLSGVTAIAAGAYHSLALKSDGTVVAWGDDSYYQAHVPAGLSGVTAVAAGAYHSLALKSDGTVVAWGDATNNQTSVPAGLSGVVAIAAGGYHSLALKSNGTVVAWGDNGEGQTSVPAGLSGVTAIAAGADFSLALKSNGTVVGWGDNDDKEATAPAGLSGVIAIAAGAYHSVALKSNGTVVAWGWNADGQASVPLGLAGVSAIAAGWQFSMAFVPATHLTVGTFNPYPAGATHSVTVQAFDTNGNAAPGYRGTIHFTSSDSKATLPADYTFTAADKGVHTFSLALTLKTAGSRSVTATDKATASITGAQTVSVTPGAAKTLSVSVGINPYPAGSTHSVTVTARDAYGNAAVGYRGAIHFTSSDTAATLPADYTFTAADAGVHKFPNTLIPGLTLKTAGSQWVRATDKTTASITGSQTVTVTPAKATHLTVGTFNPYPAGVSHSVTVKALDAYGNVATGYLGTIHFTSSDKKATLPADYTFTSADKGVHTFTAALVLKTAGSQWVRATDKTTASITGSQTVTVV